MKIVLSMLSIACLLGCQAGGFSRASNPPKGIVRLEWDPVQSTPTATLAGYKIHFGTSSGSYSHTLDVGLSTTATVFSLSTSTTYYFVATAYDTQNRESAYSNEVAKVGQLGQPRSLMLRIR